MPSDPIRASRPAVEMSVHPEGKPSSRNFPGNGKCAQVEQVYEIRVRAELGIGRDRIMLQVGDGSRSRDGRHHEDVDPAPDVLRCALQFGKLVHPPENVRCGEPGRLRDD